MSISYAKLNGANIAYRIVGDGPVDIVLVPGFISHLEVAWEEPMFARFLRQLSSFCRLIQYDKRGMGLSDRLPEGETPSLEMRVSDVLGVMDAVGSERAVLFAWSEGGPTSIRFAAKHPDRTAGLILNGTTARFVSTKGYDGIPREVMERYIDLMEGEWGSGVGLWAFAPSFVNDVKLQEWWARYQRYATSPKGVAASLRMHLDVDVRDDLTGLRTPTLVLHVEQDVLVPVAEGRYLGDKIRDARYVELPGADHMFWVRHPDEAIEEIRRFLIEDVAVAAVREHLERRPPAGWASLTEVELEVVGLIAEGLSNPQIAHRLFISRNTVETHLKHVFAKLGVTSRAELAAEATRRNA